MQSEYSLKSPNCAAFTKPNKHKMDSKDFSTTWPNLFSNTFTTVREFKRAGRGVCKDLSCQKAHVGERGELERALVDVTGTGKTVPSCHEKRFEKKLCKRRLNSLTVVKVFENKFSQVVEKSFESVLCLLGFVKAAKFGDLSEYSDCIQNVCAKSCLPCQILYIKKKKFCRARKSLGASLALQATQYL